MSPLSFEELELAWTDGPVAARDRGRLHLIVLRKGDGSHETPARAQLEVAAGIVGDRWSLGKKVHPDAQVTLMSVRVAELLCGDALPLHLAGDNLLVDIDLSVAALPAGARVAIGSALLEITPKPHLGCAKFSARFGPEAMRWVNSQAHRERRLRGVNCRIVEGGEVAVGDPVVRR